MFIDIDHIKHGNMFGVLLLLLFLVVVTFYF